MTPEGNVDRACGAEFPVYAVIDGKPIRDTLSVDILTAINSVRWYAEVLDKVYGEVATTPSVGSAKQSGFGRDRSLHALEKYTELKGISITYRP
ncbi:MAG: hypothetical protein R3C27_00390 [Hyphomonadaceae bacterium]